MGQVANLPDIGKLAICPTLLQPQAVHVLGFLPFHPVSPGDRAHFSAACFKAIPGESCPRTAAWTASSSAARYSARPGRRSEARNCPRESAAEVCSAYCRAAELETPLSTQLLAAGIWSVRKSVVAGLPAKIYRTPLRITQPEQKLERRIDMLAVRADDAQAAGDSQERNSATSVSGSRFPRAAGYTVDLSLCRAVRRM